MIVKLTRDEKKRIRKFIKFREEPFSKRFCFDNGYEMLLTMFVKDGEVHSQIITFDKDGNEIGEIRGDDNVKGIWFQPTETGNCVLEIK